MANDVISRLNTIKDSTYASKVAYETFKALGRLYERRYQKDVQESLAGLDPIFDFIDAVYLSISQKPGRMNKPIQNIFQLAFTENNLLNSLEKLEGDELDGALQDLGSFDVNEISPVKSLLMSSNAISNKEWFKKLYKDGAIHKIYSVCAAKRKLERQIDWTFCSLHNDTIPLLSEIDNNEIVQVSSLLTPTYNIGTYQPKNATVASLINRQLEKFLDGDQWQSSQHLSLLFQNYDKEKGSSYIESRMIPDANDLEEVITLLHDFKDGQTTIENTAKVMGVSYRMAKYYLDAAEMLGIFKRQGRIYCTTDFGRKLDRYSEEDRFRIIERAMTNLPIFRSFLLYLNSNNKTRFTIRDISKFLEDSTDLSAKTSQRRASTLASWLCTTGILRRRDGLYYFGEDRSQTRMFDFYQKVK